MPALENIWRDSKGQSLADFNFRTVTSKFNELVYQYPIRIPERYSLVIRSLLTQVRLERQCGVVWLRRGGARLGTFAVRRGRTCWWSQVLTLLLPGCPHTLQTHKRTRTHHNGRRASA